VDNTQNAWGPMARSGAEEVTAAFREFPDHRQADRLAAFLDAAITIGYESVVVDLCDHQEIHDDALYALTDAASRMAGSGGRLTVRSSTKVAWRIAELCPSPTLLRLEVAESKGRPRDPVRQAPPSGIGSAPPSSVLVSELIGPGAVPANDMVVDWFLDLVVSLAQAIIGGANGVSISIRRQGVLTTVAASNQTVTDMDTAQYATGEGPCVDASTFGLHVHAEALDHETRWPTFTPRARDLGINSIMSAPLVSVGRPIGAINCYSRTRAAFGPRDQNLALVIAGQTSHSLTGAGADLTHDQLAAQHTAAQVKQALRTRQVIAQAQGVVMERAAITEDGAYDLIRNFSRRSNRPVRERAEDIVASTGQLRSDHEPPKGSTS